MPTTGDVGSVFACIVAPLLIRSTGPLKGSASKLQLKNIVFALCRCEMTYVEAAAYGAPCWTFVVGNISRSKTPFVCEVFHNAQLIPWSPVIVPRSRVPPPLSDGALPLTTWTCAETIRVLFSGGAAQPITAVSCGVDAMTLAAPSNVMFALPVLLIIAGGGGCTLKPANTRM